MGIEVAPVICTAFPMVSTNSPISGAPCIGAGSTEAINGRLEALRRHALGFRNLLHYRIRSLLHCGNLTHALDAL